MITIEKTGIEDRIATGGNRSTESCMITFRKWLSLPQCGGAWSGFVKIDIKSCEHCPWSATEYAAQLFVAGPER